MTCAILQATVALIRHRLQSHMDPQPSRRASHPGSASPPGSSTSTIHELDVVRIRK